MRSAPGGANAHDRSRRGAARAADYREQKTQGQIGRDIDQDVLERDVARPRRAEESEDLRRRHAPVVERLQAGIDDGEQVREREYPREPHGVRGISDPPFGHFAVAGGVTHVG